MVIFNIPIPHLDNTAHHIATTWQLSDTKNFSNVILESVEDRTALTTKMFNVNLDPNKKYYGRYQMLLSTGWTAWGNISVAVHNDSVDLSKLEHMPSRVSIPMLTTKVNGRFCDPNNHDSTNFVIHADGYSVIGNATHVATTWVIEDLLGNVIFVSNYDKLHLNRLFFNVGILSANRVYRIRAMFHTSANDSSQFATKTVMVTGGKEIVVLSNLDLVYPDEPLVLEIMRVHNATKYRWELIDLFPGRNAVVWRVTTAQGMLRQVIPAFSLRPDANYMLRIKSDVGGTYKYVPFVTQNYKQTAPDITRPPLVVELPGANDWDDEIVAPEEGYLPPDIPDIDDLPELERPWEGEMGEPGVNEDDGEYDVGFGVDHEEPDEEVTENPREEEEIPEPEPEPKPPLRPVNIIICPNCSASIQVKKIGMKDIFTKPESCPDHGDDCDHTESGNAVEGTSATDSTNIATRDEE